MHRLVAVVSVLLGSAVWIPSAGAAPHITSVVPASGPTAGGLTITITGEDFGASGNLVMIGASPCTVTAEAIDEIQCTLPPGSGVSRPIRMIDSGGLASPPYPFGYDAPTITNIMAASMPTAGGVLITITGTNFGDGALGRHIAIGLTRHPCGDPSIDAAGRLTCTLPPGQGQNLPVDVTIDGQTSAPASLSYDPPTITDVEPSRAPAASGFVITLRGENFGSTAAVTVGGASCPVVEQSHTELSCQLPANGVAPLDVRLAVAGWSSNTVPLSYQMFVSKCDGAKVKAAGSLAQCLAKVHTKALQKGIDPSLEALATCQEKFTASCTKAQTKLDDCTNTDSCAETSALLQEWVNRVWNKQCVEKDTTI